MIEDAGWWPCAACEEEASDSSRESESSCVRGDAQGDADEGVINTSMEE